ncbi:MAG: hypothetical protein RIS31_138 [Actinomycetota bacterium]|jgi:gamma-glutamylcyclotransferase (GGCT)/AIG2-like uncharacterized protein YtfP
MSNIQNATFETALAVCGTLQPGEPNEHVLKPLNGTWIDGEVFGSLEHAGWGADVGFPGIRLAAAGNIVPVKLFTSENFPAFWSALDDFEGAEYVRVPCRVRTKLGEFTASIYALAET